MVSNLNVNQVGRARQDRPGGRARSRLFLFNDYVRLLKASLPMDMKDRQELAIQLQLQLLLKLRYYTKVEVMYVASRRSSSSSKRNTNVFKINWTD